MPIKRKTRQTVAITETARVAKIMQEDPLVKMYQGGMKSPVKLD